MLLVDTDPEVLLQRMESHRARLQTQWIHDDET
jgi:hypothetical protein